MKEEGLMFVSSLFRHLSMNMSGTRKAHRCDSHGGKVLANFGVSFETWALKPLFGAGIIFLKSDGDRFELATCMWFVVEVTLTSASRLPGSTIRSNPRFS